MDSQLINHFVRATNDAFVTMLKGAARVNGKPFLQKEVSSHREISAIIGLTGYLQGSIALSFDFDVAGRVACSFLSLEEPPPREQILDAIGELVNIVAGAAKAAIGRSDVSISLPQIVLSKEGHQLHHSAKMPGIGIPFESEFGPFVMEVRILGGRS